MKAASIKNRRITGPDLWGDVLSVRAQAPLVHSVTNFVAMNFNANALLALGASPVMAHAEEEVEEMAGIAQALVLNIGTLEPEWISAMKLAMRRARSRDIPVVLDPVGAQGNGGKADDRFLETCAPTLTGSLWPSGEVQITTAERLARAAIRWAGAVRKKRMAGVEFTAAVLRDSDRRALDDPNPTVTIFWSDGRCTLKAALR